MRLKIKKKKKSVEKIEQPRTVRTAYFGTFCAAIRVAQMTSQSHKRTAKLSVIRKFWPVLFPDQSIPDKDVDILKYKVGYKLLEMDYRIAEVAIPEQLKVNLKAAEAYEPSAFNDGMRTLARLTVANNQKGESEDMATKKTGPKKKNKLPSKYSAAKFFVEVFDKQDKKQLTDLEIQAQAKEVLGNEPSLKVIATWRFRYNKGQLEGQVTTPKEPVKAVRVKKEKPIKKEKAAIPTKTKKKPKVKVAKKKKVSKKKKKKK